MYTPLSILPDSDTAVRILDAAEVLFAERGWGGASVRAIARRAGVNLAATHYHFGSKERLFSAVFLRRIRPVNEARLLALQGVCAEAAGGVPALSGVVGAFVRPALGVARESPLFLAMMGQVLSQPPPFLLERVREEMLPVVRAFRGPLAANLPHLSGSELFWRLHFIVGALLHSASHFSTLNALGSLEGPACDVATAAQRLVDFAVAGLRAPASSP